MKTINLFSAAAFILMLATNVNAQTFELVKDIDPSGDGKPKNLMATNNLLFFVADYNDGQSTNQRLWKSDGTASGTQVMYGGQENIIDAEELTPLNGELFFSSKSEYDANELWKVGTNGNPSLVKNINTTTYAGSEPSSLTAFDGKIYFSADDGTNGREIWVSDGTSSGTQLLKDINPSGDSNPRHLKATNNFLFFVVDANNGDLQLAKTDGTSGGTQIIPEINSGAANLMDIKPRTAVLNGEVYMSLSHEFDGFELWKTNGTTFEEVKNIENPTGVGAGSGVNALTTFNGKVYFHANDGTNGHELWVTDGTSTGTQMLKDIRPGSQSSFPRNFSEYNGKLYFTANDGTNGRELWVTDGTTGGTQMLVDINPGSSSSSINNMPDSGYYDFVEYDGLLYFTADDGTNGDELWATDGTVAGTQKTQPAISPNNNPLVNFANPFLTVFDNSLYFVANYDSNGRELWKLTTSNMSVAETTQTTIGIYPNPVKDILQVKTEQQITGIALYSITGQQLQTWENAKNLDLSPYAPGTYFIQVNTQNGRMVKQIIKN